jgi:hypothetical protein
VNEKTEKIGIRVLTEEELISAVVEKHRRFLEDDIKEFEELTSKLNQIEEDAKNLKNSRIKFMERKEILKEKRQQFYHQAEALLKKELFPKLNQITTDKLKEDIKKLTGQIEPEEEQKLKDLFIQNLRETYRVTEFEENLLLQTQVRLEEAKNSNLELKGIVESEKQFEEDDSIKDEEISKIKSQHKLLNSKIKNHVEALDYWGKLKK